MHPKSLWLLSLMLTLACGKESPAFPIKLKTADKTEVTFPLVFSCPHLLISENLFACEKASECELVSSVRHYDYFNSTSYSYLSVRLSLYTSDNQKLTLSARYTDLPYSVFGMSYEATWKESLQAGCLRVDLVTGATQYLVSLPADAHMLQTNPDSKQFYLTAKLHVEADVMAHWTRAKSDANLRLDFPNEKNEFDGQYFFLLTSNHVEGWEAFLTAMSVKNVVDDLVIDLHLDEKRQLRLGADLFRAYDGEALKRMSDYYDKTETHIGRYFVLKSNMRLFVEVKDKDSPLRAAVEVTDGKFGYFYWFSWMGFLNFATWLVFWATVVSVVLHVLPARYKAWIPPLRRDTPIIN